jgi:hypothetical protein
MGKGMPPAACVIDADTTLLSRNVISHQPDQWMRVVDLSNASTRFIPSAIRVKKKSANVKVAFVDTNGVFWVWGAPAKNVDFTWLLPPTPTGTFGAVAYVGTDSPSTVFDPNPIEMNFDNLAITTQF